MKKLKTVIQACTITHYSNLRMIDSINTEETLIDRAFELGLRGVAITDHESLRDTSKH